MTKEMAERITCLLNNKSLAISVLDVSLFSCQRTRFKQDESKRRLRRCFNASSTATKTLKPVSPVVYNFSDTSSQKVSGTWYLKRRY